MLSVTYDQFRQHWAAASGIAADCHLLAAAETGHMPPKAFTTVSTFKVHTEALKALSVMKTRLSKCNGARGNPYSATMS